MRIEDALSHYCRNSLYKRKHETNFSSVASTSAFYGIPWDSEFAEYEFSAKLSALVREVVIECSENPDAITSQEMNEKRHRLACFGAGGEITVLNWVQAVSSRARPLDGPTLHLLHLVSLSATVTMEMCCVGSCGLTNYRNMCPNRRTKGVFGVVSTVGEQGNLKTINSVVNGSVLSGVTFPVRGFFPICKCTPCGAPSDVGVSIGTKLQTRPKMIITETRMQLRCSNIGQETVFKLLDHPVIVLESFIPR